MTIRDDTIAERFNGWLERYAPPRYLAGNEKGVQDEADDMLRTVLRYAPRDNYDEWLEDMLDRLAEGMTTRAWPAPGELAKACKAAGVARQMHRTAQDAAEENAVNRLADWFSKFGSEMPGTGAPGRTAALIQRGVFENERDARFRGFMLDRDQQLRAQEQPMARDEREAHERVQDKLASLVAERAAAVAEGSPHQRGASERNWSAA